MKLLFIGNSFTARNQLPALLEKLAASHGKEVRHRLISAGGASLRMHWNKEDALKEIEKGGYDYVVLQEQSTLPVKNPARTQENIRLFDEPIRAAGARMVLYLTWARRDVPETQGTLSQTYISVGKELGAIVVPAGVAWQRFLSEHPEPRLHDADGSHPTLAGSYLAACVFYAVLFGENPAGHGAHSGGLPPEDAQRLQFVAWETARESDPGVSPGSGD